MSHHYILSHLHCPTPPGDMDCILEAVMCAEIKDEPRFNDIISGLVKGAMGRVWVHGG